MSAKKIFTVLLGLLVSSCSDAGENISRCIEDDPCGNDAGIIRYVQHVTPNNSWNTLILWDDRGRNLSNPLSCTETFYRVRLNVRIGFRGNNPDARMRNIVSVHAVIFEVDRQTPFPAGIRPRIDQEFTNFTVYSEPASTSSYMCQCRTFQHICNVNSTSSNCGACELDTRNRLYYRTFNNIRESNYLFFRAFRDSEIYARVSFNPLGIILDDR